jgi:acyl-CoA synthetase (AMP-forming)/AMP-acid ligase II
MILSQMLSTAAAKDLARPAISYLLKDGSYSEFKTRVSRLSYLYQKEIGNNARIALLTRNAPAVAASFFAFTNIRALSIPVNPDLPPEQITDWIRDSKATHVAVTSDLVGKAREWLSVARLNLPLIEVEKKQGGEYDTSFSPQPDNVPTDNDKILLFRTGGSIEKPKYVYFNHKQIASAATAIRGHYKLSPTDRFLSAMSWAHPFAFVHHLLLPLLNGATVVIDHGADAKEMIEFLVKSRTTRIVGTPPYFLKLLVTCKNEQYKLPGIKSVTAGLGPLDPPVRKAFQLLKIPAMQTYGQAEAGWTIAMEDVSTPELPLERGAVGRGLAGMKYKVLDVAGDEIPGKGKREGYFAASGPSVMSGYMDLEKETKNAIRGTWLYTGDYASLEGDGEELKITFLGRKDDLVLREGKILSSEPIDGGLKGLAGVQDGAGFPIKTMRGDWVFACAVVRAEKALLSEKQVMEHLAAKVPSEVAPVVVVFTDYIPRDPGGNILRFKLSRQFSGLAG